MQTHHALLCSRMQVVYTHASHYFSTGEVGVAWGFPESWMQKYCIGEARGWFLSLRFIGLLVYSQFLQGSHRQMDCCTHLSIHIRKLIKAALLSLSDSVLRFHLYIVERKDDRSIIRDKQTRWFLHDRHFLQKSAFKQAGCVCVCVCRWTYLFLFWNVL